MGILDYKGTKELFEDEDNIPYLDCGGSYMNAYVCQNSQKFTCKEVNFTVCKFYCNKPGQNKQTKNKPVKLRKVGNKPSKHLL